MRPYQAKKIPVPPRTIHSPIKDPNCDNNIKVRIRDGRTIDVLIYTIIYLFLIEIETFA